MQLLDFIELLPRPDWPAFGFRRFVVFVRNHMSVPTDPAPILQMTKKHTDPAKPRKSPGPAPEVLKIEGDWKEAVKKSLQKQAPAAGWPKTAPRKSGK